MDDRAKIPGLALLSLSFTTCVDRSTPDDPDVDPIVGDWHAIEIDGDKFPMVFSEAPYFLQSGVEVNVTADLKGRFVLVQESYYQGYQGRAERGSTLVVDESGAPKYRLDVRHDPFGGYNDEGYAEYADGYDVGPVTGHTGGYTTSGYDPTTGDDTFGTTTSDSTTSDSTTSGSTTGGTTTTSGSTTGGAIGEPGAASPGRPLQIPVPVHRAPAEMVLRCTLDRDTLTCDRDGDEQPGHFVFRRTIADAPDTK